MARPSAACDLRGAGRAAQALGILALLGLLGGCSGDDDSSKSGTTPVVSNFPDAQIYVDAHNQVRAAVLQPSSYAGSWQPVGPVAWSNEVAATAQNWANYLRDAKDCGLEHAMGSGYGENLAAGSNIGAQRAVDMWASEVEDYSYAPQYAFETGTGHYTQIVWRGTERIGCASAACSSRNVVVCRYDPPGNFIGATIY